MGYAFNPFSGTFDLTPSAAALRQKAIATKTATYTITSADEVILASAGSSFTVNLPQASTVTGYSFTVQKIDSSTTTTVTIDPFSTELIAGASTLVLVDQWQSVTFISNGTAWYVI
jgi:hypothetical protein